jgi:methionyl-tRNA formyltransferase
MTDLGKVHSLALWLAKPLAVNCLRYLVECILPKYPQIHIASICLSQRDESLPELLALAQKHHLKTIIIPNTDRQQKKLIASALHNFLGQNVDLGLVIGFPHKIAPEQFQFCQQGVINLHFAPLPHYRGSGTLTHAMINGEKDFGVTFHFIDQHLDTGPIIVVKRMSLDAHKTAQQFSQQLEKLAFQFFQEWIERFLTEEIESCDQSELTKLLRITPQLYTRASVKKLYQLSWDWPAEKILRYVRALTIGKTQKPYLQIDDQKIYLSLEP